MLHRFAFKNGAVSYANKYLQSREYREAMDKGQITVPGFATDPGRSIFHDSSPSLRPTASKTATSILLRWTAAPSPSPMRQWRCSSTSQTLKTLGVFDYGGDKLPGVMTTAHPHFDSKGRSLVNLMTEMGLKSKYNVLSHSARAKAA